ncbi:MAG: aminotransferase class I/II-fold pyridoxal phosphate-dependent enzyme [Chloroflexota bacterium]
MLTPTIHTTPSPTLYINERVSQLWAEDKTVYHLGFGESRFPVHPKLQAALADNTHQKSYLAGQGLHELRHKIAQFYGRHFGIDATAAQVMLGPGSKALLYALQMALGADLILPTPSWVSYAPQAQLLNRPVYYVFASAQDDYALTVDALDATIRQSNNPRKILLINSPNNPTGQMFTADFLEQLAAYCREQQIVVLSDEIYALTPHGQKQHTSIATYYPEGTVVLGGISKHLSLGGWRLGAAVLPAGDDGQALMQGLCTIASEVWSTPSAPVQYAAIAAYADDPDITNYIDECAQIHAVRSQHLWGWLTEMGITCAQPDGAFYMFPNFDRWKEPLAAKGVHTSTDLAAYLLDNYQIATLPGLAFGTPPEELSLRLASSYLDMETDAKAEALLQAYRTVDSPDVFMSNHHPMMQTAIGQFQKFFKSLG